MLNLVPVNCNIQQELNTDTNNYCNDQDRKGLVNHITRMKSKLNGHKHALWQVVCRWMTYLARFLLLHARTLRDNMLVASLVNNTCANWKEISMNIHRKTNHIPEDNGFHLSGHTIFQNCLPRTEVSAQTGAPFLSSTSTVHLCTLCLRTASSAGNLSAAKYRPLHW